MKILIISAFVLLGMNVFSQTAPSLRTARPAKTIGVRVVGTKVFQHQVAFNYIEGQATETYQYANSFRYGLSERLEVSAVANLSRVDQTLNDREGLSNTQLGFRVALFNTPKQFIRGAAFQFRLRLPWESDDFKTTGVSSIGVLSFTQNLYSKWGLRYNLGFNEVDRSLNYNYSVNLSRRITSRINTFIEGYGDFSGSNDRLFFNSGISYLICSDLQVDAAVGRGKNRGVYQSFASLGFSWRVMP